MPTDGGGSAVGHVRGVCASVECYFICVLRVERKLALCGRALKLYGGAKL